MSEDDKHPFRMEVQDGLDRDRPIELVARGGRVILSSETGYWSIKLTPAQGRVLAAAIGGASDRAETQAT